ncbi:MAG: LamG-like jellyroll fold domain-containing protein, partial [Isosphaeraceae bacterium]
TFTLPPESVSLMAQGTASFTLNNQTWFAINGELDIYFGATTTASGSVDPEFYAYINGALVIGPSSAPYFDFATTGFLQISDQGIAATFNLTLSGSQALAAAGITLGNDQFELTLNTTGQDVSFTPPSITDPNQPGTSPPVNIPAAPNSSSPAESYLEIQASGSLDIENTIDLSGTFNLLIAPTVIDIGLDANFAFGGVLAFQVQGGLILNTGGSAPGLVAALNLEQTEGIPSTYGFSLNTSFLLEVNSTGQSQSLGGINVPAGINGTNSPYVLVQATGDLLVGSFDIYGTFDFTSNATSTTIAASGTTSLGPLGQASVNGQITIDTAQPGIYGILQTSLDTTPSLQGFSFNANFQFEINTTSVLHMVTGFLVNPISGQTTANQSVTIQKGVEVDAGGQLAIFGSFTVGGEFDLNLSANGLALNVNATLNVFGINLSVVGDAEIDYGAQAGLILDIGVNGSINLPLSFGNLTGNAEVDLNTIQGVYDVSITNVSGSLLGLSASGSASITDNQGDVSLSGNLNVNFLNIVNLAFSGNYDSNGSFSFTAAAGFSLDLAGLFGVGFGGSVSISNSGFSSNIDAYLDLGLLGTIYGSASLSYQGGAFYVNVNINGVNLVNVYLGSSTPPTDNIEIQSFSVPEQGTEEQAITTSATVVDPDYSTIINNGDVENMEVTWTVTKNGQPFSTYTQYYTYEHYTTIFHGSGTSTFSFVPDDAGTYQVTAAVQKDITNFSNNSGVQFIGPVTSVGTVVVAGLPPSINSISAPRFAQVGQSVNLSASASDPSPVESPLTYSWDISRNGQPFQTGSGSSYSFTPSAPGVYTETLTVSDPAGRSVSQTETTLVSGGVITVTSAASTDMPTDGSVTLAEALEYTAAIPGSYQIDFAPSLSGQTITLPAALTITGDVTIDGTDAPGLVLSGSAGAFAGITALTVGAGATVTLRDLTVSGGSGLFGGAIDNNGILTLADSTIENSSAQYGGGIFNSSAATLTVIDSTIANNAATNQAGGGIDNSGTLTLIDSTIAYNRSVNTAGGVYNASGATATVQGTIIAANSATNTSPDVNGTFISLGNNLIGNTAGATGFTASDLTNVANPGLAPLASNGGPTPTIALLPGSPALDAGFVPAASTPSLPGLIHEWNGEGNANDSAGSSNGTLTSTGVFYATGVVGQAFQFSGSGGYVTLPTSADVTGTVPLSISVWIKTSSDGVIIQQRDPNNSNGEYQLAVQGGKVYWWDNANGQYGFQVTSTRAVADGQWHHIVAVREANG